GGLWVADMYRYVIEHPKWIPAAQLAKLDVRAGAGRGRIYRVLPEGAAARPVRDLTKLSDEDLVAALDTPNGPARDLVQARFAQLGVATTDTLEALRRLAKTSGWPATRAQALATLEVLRMLAP